MLESRPVWKNGEGFSGEAMDGMFPSRPVAPAATAATPALYFRKSLLETGFLTVEFSLGLFSVTLDKFSSPKSQQF